MSCVLVPRAVAAPIPVTIATPLRRITRCAVRSGVRFRTRSVVWRLAVLGLVVAVALVPQTSGAQSTVSATHSTRHTVRADVRIVTQAAFLSHQRLAPEQAALLPSSGSVWHADGAWISTVEVRSNVSSVLLLEPRAVVPGGAPWLVVDAEGQLVPWTSQAIRLSKPLSPGRHTVSLIWVAPDATSAPPDAALRVQPSP